MSTVYNATIAIDFYKEYDEVQSIIEEKDDYPESIIYDGEEIEFGLIPGYTDIWGYELKSTDYPTPLDLDKLSKIDIDTIKSNLEGYFGFEINDLALDLIPTQY